MFFLMRFTEGLLLAFGCLLLSYVLGAAALMSALDYGAVSREHRILRVAVRCAVGFAIIGFAGFALGQVRLFTPLALAGVLGAFLGVSIIVHRKRVHAFRAQMADLASFCNGTTLAVLCVMLVLAVPATITRNYGFDAINYHLAYAQEWAHAHAVTIDPFVQFPFYASNYLLLYVALLQLHLDVFVMFLNWGIGFVCAASIAAVSGLSLRPVIGKRASAFVGVALAVAVYACPFFLRWFSSAFVDPSLGAFALFSILALHLALAERKPQWLFAAAAIVAFLVGMKSSFLVLAPAGVIALLLVARTMRMQKRTAVGVVALFVVLASPWYVRNLVMAGDPIPPTLNIALHRRDGLMTNGEWSALQKSFRHIPDRNSMLRVPYDGFFQPASDAFEDDGSDALLLLAYAPFIAGLALFALGRADQYVALYAGGVGVLVCYWLGTSTLLRYSMLFFPLLAAALPVVLAPFLRGRRVGAVASAVIAAAALLTITPSPAALQPMPQGTYFFHRFYYGNYKYVLESYVSDWGYQQQFDPDYRAEEFSSEIIAKYALPRRIYMFIPVLRFYFARHGIQAIGEWVGPSGYLRFVRAIQIDKAAAYLQSLGTKAVIVSPAAFHGGLTPVLEQQLGHAGYCTIPVPSTDDVLIAQLPHSACVVTRTRAKKYLDVALSAGGR